MLPEVVVGKSAGDSPKPGGTLHTVQVKEIVHGIMAQVAEAYGLNTDFRALVNPTGRFVQGGSFADTGVTGRKIIADTYGGMCRHGGGAFSGRDPSKVDRSAAYMARKIARGFVLAGYAKRCEIQLAYAIGMKEPVSVNVNCFGTETVAEKELAQLAQRQYDLTPAGIIEALHGHRAADGGYRRNADLRRASAGRRRYRGVYHAPEQRPGCTIF